MLEIIKSLKSEAFTPEMRESIVYVADLSDGSVYEGLPLVKLGCIHNFGTRHTYFEMLERVEGVVYHVLVYHRTYFTLQLAGMDPIAVRMIYAQPSFQTSAMDGLLAYRDAFISKTCTLTYRSYVDALLEAYVETEDVRYATSVVKAINDVLNIFEHGRPGDDGPCTMVVEEAPAAFQNRVNGFLMQMDMAAEKSEIQTSMDPDVLRTVLES